jgi:hypothetical protein
MHGTDDRYNTLIGKHERKRPLRRPKHRCKDNIKMDLKGIGWKGGGPIHLAQNRDKGWALVNTLMNLQVP